jgi:hypothetical protein
MRDRRDEEIRGRVGTHALYQPVGGNCVARVSNVPTPNARWLP